MTERSSGDFSLRFEMTTSPNTMPTELIHAKNIAYHINTRPLIEHINLTIQPKEIVTLIGPNGSGKTTLVRLLLGTLTPSAGTFTRKENLRIGYVPQRMTVEAHFPITVRRFMQLAGPQTDEERGALLHQVEVAQLGNHLLHELSGGELQRVLLARAIARKPELLVLDEPVQGVDVNGQIRFYEHITRLRDELGCAILMVSHDLHLVMASTDRVLCINRHICCEGKPEHVRTHPEFLELFGPKAAEMLSVYHHHHDHAHGWKEEVRDHERCNHA